MPKVRCSSSLAMSSKSFSFQGSACPARPMKTRRRAYPSGARCGNLVEVQVQARARRPSRCREAMEIYEVFLFLPSHVHPNFVEPTLRDVRRLMVCRRSEVVPTGSQGEHGARVQRVEDLELAHHAHAAHVEDFRQLDIELVEAIATATDSVREVLARVHASVAQATAELNQIEMLPPTRQQHRASCFDCGQKNLEVFHTSTRHGYHLCPECFRSREQRGLARMQTGASQESTDPEAICSSIDAGFGQPQAREVDQPRAGVRR